MQLTFQGFRSLGVVPAFATPSPLVHLGGPGGLDRVLLTIWRRPTFGKQGNSIIFLVNATQDLVVGKKLHHITSLIGREKRNSGFFEF